VRAEVVAPWDFVAIDRGCDGVLFVVVEEVTAEECVG
jgi:hypothetical protein